MAFVSFFEYERDYKLTNNQVGLHLWKTKIAVILFKTFSFLVEHCRESWFKIRFRWTEVLNNFYHHSNRVLLLLPMVIIYITHGKELHQMFPNCLRNETFIFNTHCNVLATRKPCLSTATPPFGTPSLLTLVIFLQLLIPKTNSVFRYKTIVCLDTDFSCSVKKPGICRAATVTTVTHCQCRCQIYEL